jgi:hypothetical protein
MSFGNDENSGERLCNPARAFPECIFLLEDLPKDPDSQIAASAFRTWWLDALFSTERI